MKLTALCISLPVALWIAVMAVLLYTAHQSQRRAVESAYRIGCSFAGHSRATCDELATKYMETH